MKILVIGGMHGNETLGIEVVELFKAKPINRVDTLLANQEAIKANCRFVGQDLNRSFPGDSQSSKYESQRAAEILKLTKKYDIVLDFHNTHCPDNDCGFIGNEAEETLTDAAWLLGLDKVIVADYDCINKAAKNCLSIEVSLDSPLNDAKLWYERITMLSRLTSFNTEQKVEKFRFVYRMTLENKVNLQLNKQSLAAFKPMDKKLADAMGVNTPAYPIFIGDSFTPYNYGGVLNRL